MYLSNPFPPEVRLLYLYCWECFECGENGQNSGGLEIHHIRGRISDSALNSSCLCKRCHARMNHNQEEEQRIFLKTLKFLFNQQYVLTEKDLQFIRDNYNRLITEETLKWIQ